MKLEKHDLHHEFPEFHDAIHALKVSDAHFAALFDQYHQINREVQRIETGVENTSDVYLEQRKKERLHLKDTLYQQLCNWKGQ
ncbi:MAG TPA: YdcH family protein [Porticoccaceae bacterium]|nr:YdcH family protein [Porticoccaceae bacterium]